MQIQNKDILGKNPPNLNSGVFPSCFDHYKCCLFRPGFCFKALYLDFLAFQIKTLLITPQKFTWIQIKMTKISKPESKNKLSKKKKNNSLFAVVLKMEFLGLWERCFDMSHAVTSVMFCYVNMLRWITVMPQQPRNVKHRYLDTRWETALMCA